MKIAYALLPLALAVHAAPIADAGSPNTSGQLARATTADLESTLKLAGLPTELLGPVTGIVKVHLGSVLPTGQLESALAGVGVPAGIIGQVVDAVKGLLGDVLGPLGPLPPKLPLPLPSLPSLPLPHLPLPPLPKLPLPNLPLRDLSASASASLEVTLTNAGVPADILGDVVVAVNGFVGQLLGPLGSVTGRLPIPPLPVRDISASATASLEAALTNAGVSADILGNVVSAVKGLLGQLLGPLGGVLPLPGLPLALRDTVTTQLNVQLAAHLKGLGLGDDLVGEVVGAVNNLVGGALAEALAGVGGSLALGGNLALGTPQHPHPK